MGFPSFPLAARKAVVTPGGGGGFQNQVLITATQNWNVPVGVTIVRIVLIGGGASGASAANSGYAAGGGGGGSGAIVDTLLDITGQTVIPVTIGAGGAAPVSLNTPGQDGGNSSFGSFVSAFGGKAGGMIIQVSPPYSYDPSSGGKGGQATPGFLWVSQPGQSATEQFLGTYRPLKGGAGGFGGYGANHFSTATERAAQQYGGGGGGGGINPDNSDGAFNRVGGAGMSGCCLIQY